MDDINTSYKKIYTIEIINKGEQKLSNLLKEINLSNDDLLMESVVED